jgi:hypothetical protein
MSGLKQIITEIVMSKLAEVTHPPLHSELKKLGNTHFQPGNGSESSSLFRGGKNTHFDTVHKMATDRGYKKLYSRGGDTEYHKDLNGGKETAKITVRHDGKHVYSVGTITYHNHY